MPSSVMVIGLLFVLQMEDFLRGPEVMLRGEETILLVDDTDMILDVGKEILEALGYAVFLARSGKEAIEVYDQLKEINRDIKVLLSSGYSIEGQATEILKRGCNAFIQKPFNIEKLSHKIREILDK